MALDEVLLNRVATAERAPTLRFWRWTEPALVLGSHQSVANEVYLDAARGLGFKVVRRMSGGGTMIAEPGRTITYSLYLPAATLAGLTFAESYRRLDAWAVRGLQALGVPASYRPLNDIVTPRGKVAGAAQARRRHTVLHHTTMAHTMDTDLVGRLIRLGRDRLSPAGIRSAEKAVSPLSWFTNAGLEEVERYLLTAFQAENGGTGSALRVDELHEARDLAAAKYVTPEWTYRLP
jgi:lipoate---protein ligase